MTTIIAPDTSALTHATTQAAQWGAEIEELHQKSLTTGAESLRAMMDAGDRLQQAFESPDRKQHFPSFEDWVRRFAHIAPRTADNYRRLARQRDEVEAHIQQVLAEGQSPSLNGAIAYLKAEIDRDDMPAWAEIERLLEPVGRVRTSIGNRLIFEPKTWAERYVTGLPKVYPDALALWVDWKANSETWIEQVNEARDREIERQREAIAGQNASQASHAEANEQTPVAPKSATATGQDQAAASTGVVWLDYADQVITQGCEVIYRGDDTHEIGVVKAFSDYSDGMTGEVAVLWPVSGECWHPPQMLMVCSDSQCDADEDFKFEPGDQVVACDSKCAGTVVEYRQRGFGREPIKLVPFIHWTLDEYGEPCSFYTHEEESQISLIATAEELEAVTPEVVPDDGSDHFYRMNATGGNGERNTPERYWRPSLEMWGLEAFDLDPMTNANSSVPARTQYTEAENGLIQPWNVKDGEPVHLFSNPDFGLNKEFVEKLTAELQQDYNLEAIIFNKLDTRVEWCQRLLELSSCICLVTEYVTFEGLDKHGQPLIQSPFSLCYYYIGDRPGAFAEAHKHLGMTFAEIDAEFEYPQS